MFFLLYFSFETEDWNCKLLFHRNFSQRGTFFSSSGHKATLHFFLILNFCAHQLNDPNIMIHCLTQFLEFDPIMAVNRKLDFLRKSAFDKWRMRRHNQVHWLSRALTIGTKDANWQVTASASLFPCLQILCTRAQSCTDRIWCHFRLLCVRASHS